MMIAIHKREGSYSDKWIEYCEKNKIKYKLVNAFDSDILEQVKGYDGFMWHWQHNNYVAQLFARQLTLSIEKMGLKVFPNSQTNWHYDDKVGQKYLLEAIGAPLIPTYVFYNKRLALTWASSTTYPKVFKTRNGAGSLNVRLIKNFQEARKIITKCFKSGISPNDKINSIKESLWRYKRNKDLKSIGGIVKRILNSVYPDYSQPERNYAYFQDFIPNCEFDYRIKVIGNRAWGFRRFVRENDFRASGSGLVDFDASQIPLELINLAFKITNELNLQSVSYDFVKHNKKYFLIELSYASGMTEGQADKGFWDSNLNWNEGKFIPEYLMIKDFIKEIEEKEYDY